MNYQMYHNFFYGPMGELMRDHRDEPNKLENCRRKSFIKYFFVASIPRKNSLQRSHTVKNSP